MLSDKSKLTIGLGAAIVVLSTVAALSADYQSVKSAVASNREVAAVRQVVIDDRLKRIEDAVSDGNKKLDRIIEHQLLR